MTLAELTDACKTLPTPDLDKLVDRAQLILSLRSDNRPPRRGRPYGSRNKPKEAGGEMDLPEGKEIDLTEVDIRSVIGDL